MTDFDALLKRSFAEAHEPADDGFAIAVGHAVAHKESAQKIRNVVYAVSMAVAGAAILYGGYGFVSAFGDEMLASVGLEAARAHGALSSAPSVGAAAQGMLQSISAGLSQMLLVFGALAGGAVAYRASQD